MKEFVVLEILGSVTFWVVVFLICKATGRALPRPPRGSGCSSWFALIFIVPPMVIFLVIAAMHILVLPGQAFLLLLGGLVWKGELYTSLYQIPPNMFLSGIVDLVCWVIVSVILVASKNTNSK